MKQRYTSPELEILKLKVEEILTGSEENDTFIDSEESIFG